MNTKYFLVALLGVLLVGVAVYYFTQNDSSYTKDDETDESLATTTNNIPEENVATTTETERGPESTIGKSVSGNDIKAYHLGEGEKEVMFIGGIHGGYSRNTVALAFEMIDWLNKNPNAVPKEVTVTVIPVLNPDGLKKVTGKTDRFTAADVNKSTSVQTEGRFNTNGVDLNRNFDCEWQSVGTWQSRDVSGGETVFSEPESQAIRDYINTNKPTAIVTWYSAEGAVYASNCKDNASPETKTLTDLYAKASGYKAKQNFDHYEITGDMANWFASQNIPAISVLLTTHDQTEWSKNQAGVEAVLKHYAE